MNDNELLTCCHLETGRCIKIATWEILPEGAVYEIDYSCDEHLISMLCDGVNKVWPANPEKYK